MLHRTTPAERFRALVFAVVVMALTSVPYLIGFRAQGDRSAWVFSGHLIGVEDGNSYIAKMRLGARDGWLFQMVYSSEPHTPAFIFAPYIALGKVAAIFQNPASDDLAHPFYDPLIGVFHTARILFGILAILAIHQFAALFLLRGSTRWAALVLATLGGGLGWLLVVQPERFGVPIDLYLPEAYTFLMLYALPHLALARAALLIGFVLLIRGEKPRHWLLAGACWLVMGLCVPFYIAVLYALLGLWGLAVWIRLRRFPIRLFIRCLVAAVIPLPYLIYNTLIFATDPVLGAWSNQNQLPSPNPLHYVAGFLVPGVLALFAVRWAWRRGGSQVAYLLLPVWAFASPLLAYLPVSVQRRLLEGVFVPLCILAMAGLRYAIAPRLRSRGRYRRRTTRRVWQNGLTITGVLMLPITGLLLIEGTLTAGSLAMPAFQPAQTIRNLIVVGNLIPAGAVALSDYNTGNLIPAWTNLRAYLGHGPETINAEQKKRLVAEAFANRTAARLPAGETIHAVILPGCIPPDLALMWSGFEPIDMPDETGSGLCRAGYRRDGP